VILCDALKQTKSLSEEIIRDKSNVVLWQPASYAAIVTPLHEARARIVGPPQVLEHEEQLSR